MSLPIYPIERELVAQGLHCYREHFRWGYSPAYRNDDSTKFRFVVSRDRALNPADMLAELKKDWLPAYSDDVSFFMYQMETEFNSMPQG